MTMTLTSPSFQHEGEIPKECTCDGSDLFPGLDWKNIPRKTKSLVLICDDPDVPEMLRDNVPDLTWDHMILFDIPPTSQGLPHGRLHCPHGSLFGTNSWSRNDYGGPCPPDPHHHRYFFTLYALDVESINLDASAHKKDVLKAIEGHILEQATLMGRYLKEAFKSS